MAGWFEIVIRQMILYSLPVVITLSILWMQQQEMDDKAGAAQRGVDWAGALLPLVAAIVFHRAVIVAFPRSPRSGVREAGLRFATHCVLAIIGWMLFTLSLRYQATVGTPPLYHWWVKVLMFFNLCMAAMHLLPLPGMLVGAWVLRLPACAHWCRPLHDHWPWFAAALAASPLLDLLSGRLLIFPVYEQLSRFAIRLAG